MQGRKLGEKTLVQWRKIEGEDKELEREIEGIKERWNKKRYDDL